MCTAGGSLPWKNWSKEEEPSWESLPKSSFLNLKPSPELSSGKGWGKRARGQVLGEGKEGIGLPMWGAG